MFLWHLGWETTSYTRAFSEARFGEVPTFATIQEFKDHVQTPGFDPAVPYLIQDCDTLKKLSEAPLSKTALTTVRAQLSKSDQVKSKKKAQCPYHVHNAIQVRPAMLELSPPNRVALKPEPVLSQWGCQADMLQASLEYACFGNLRFTVKGSREVACVHANDVLALADSLAEARGRLPVTFSEKVTVPEVIEKTLMTEMTEAGLAVAEKAGMKAWRATAAAGSLMFVPSGFACVDRGLGTDVIQGWRLHVVEHSTVLESVSKLEEKFKMYSSADKNLVLKGFQALRDKLDRDEKRAANEEETKDE